MQSTLKRWAIAFLLVAGWATSAQADVSLHGMFGDGMVLQRNAKVPVWGKADDGEKVTVAIQGQTKTTEAKDGKWMVMLENLKAGGPFTLTVTGKNRLELTDVLVGEVWLCSGQSNMEWALRSTRDSKKAIENSTNPMIRLYQVPKTPSKTEQSEMGLGKTTGKWVECNPQTVPGFTAVGYYFGRDLQKELKVPVGLIQSAWGGTPAEHWTSADVLKKINMRGTSQLYNGMIKPVQPFQIAGAIWYQGESNAGSPQSSENYYKLFSAMINNWRSDWGYDFPFLFVQLAPWDRPDRAKAPWAFLRESQLLTALNVPKTGMAVITDYGHPTDIHPQDKEPVGARLALSARAIAYGQDIVHSGPVYKGMKKNGSTISLMFDHVGGGLVAKDEKLKGFTIAGEDMKFVPANAKIVGKTVVVSSPEVNNPVAVRFGWENYPVVNFFNREGLPATPFRTDGRMAEQTKK